MKTSQLGLKTAPIWWSISGGILKEKNIRFILLQGEGEHNEGELHNELQQLGQPEIVHFGDQRLQQGEINLWTDVEGQGGRSERPTLRLQKGAEWLQEVRGPVDSLHLNV